MTIETKVGTSGSSSVDDTKDKAKTTLEGDLDLHYLGVKSVKMISASCM